MTNSNKVPKGQLKAEHLVRCGDHSLHSLLNDVKHQLTKDQVKTLLKALGKISNVLRTRGPKEAIRLSKEGRTQLYSILATTKKGTLLGFKNEGAGLNGQIHSQSPDQIRLLASVLSFSRTIRLKPEINSKNIEAPFIGLTSSIKDEYIPGFGGEMGKPFPFKDSSKYSPKWYPRFKAFHFTSKSGPNGQALSTFLEDLISLSESQLEAIKILGGYKLSGIIDTGQKILSLTPGSYSGQYTRRIAAISDKEGKTREIAILDYGSQTALKPLHDYLFKILENIPQDCTFKQGSFKEKLGTSTEFNSVDLTAATDRFPIEQISKILEYNLGRRYVEAWKHIMVGTPFWSAQLKREISYAVGNPMGAYSSGASFALSHHFIVYSACRNLNKDWKKANYVLLGDDIVINDNDLADEYRKLLATLGVEVSPAKTHKSENFYEFAKRIIYLGVEVTPFPVNALVENYKHPLLMVSDLVDLHQKGGTLIELDQFIINYMKRCGFRSAYANRFRNQIKNSEHGVKIFRGSSTPAQVVLPAFESSDSSNKGGESLNSEELDFAAFQAIRVAMLEVLVSQEFGILTAPLKEADGESNLPDKQRYVLGLKALKEHLYWLPVYLKVTEESVCTPLKYLLPTSTITENLITQREILENRKELSGSAGLDGAFLMHMATSPLNDEKFIISKKDSKIRVSSLLFKHLKNYSNLISEFCIGDDFRGQRLSDQERSLFSRPEQTFTSMPQR